MKYIKILFFMALAAAAVPSCDLFNPDGSEPEIIDIEPMGVLDIAFTYRFQSIPPTRMRKVDLCLAYTADDLYMGVFFTQANVSDAVVHYRFELPPGEYYYYASVICLCEGDSCKYAGFPGQNGLAAAGGKVTVEDGKITNFTTQFH